jgi:error-prone DNA polymerase
MARKGITGDAADQIVTSITSFALYGFPESHAASFALLAYASAYLKAHYPAAFYAALLNNQPMGFYHPSTLVKDAQRRGVRFQPIDVQISGWDCTVEQDGAIRLGLRYVNGLRQEVGTKIATERASGSGLQASGVLRCPKCGCDDPSMLEEVNGRLFCNICSHDWAARGRESTLEAEGVRSRDSERGWGPASSKKSLAASGVRRFASLDDLVARTGLRRDEVVTLADIGALNSFGYDRRSALWQAERAVRPSGELFENVQLTSDNLQSENDAIDASLCKFPLVNCELPSPCPLKPMTEAERLVADYAGTGLTVGRHPMALGRDELAMRGVLRAIDLRTARQGRRVRVAGMVITRQRPGTAKGFVFLTLEDETGVANIIVRPDLFARDRLVIVEEPFLVVEGVLQNQDGVTSVRAEAVQGMRGVDIDFDAHDFY